MPFKTFLKVDGIPGECMDDRHTDWIEITGFEHEISPSVSGTTGSTGGAAAGRADFAPVTITKETDCASPKLYEASYNGTRIEKVTIEVCRADGDRQKYLEIRMEQVIVSRFVLAGSGSHFPGEVVRFNPAKMELNYFSPFCADGTASSVISAKWDLTGNQPTG